MILCMTFNSLCVLKSSFDIRDWYLYYYVSRDRIPGFWSSRKLNGTVRDVYYNYVAKEKEAAPAQITDFIYLIFFLCIYIDKLMRLCVAYFQSTKKGWHVG
jgi:hypothetical protein